MQLNSLKSHAEICQWDTASYLIFSDNVFGSFIYYSHFFPSLTALLIGFFVFYSNPKGLANRLLLLLAVVFSIWSYLDLILWASGQIELIMFVWSILIYFDLLLYVTAFYFFYAFLFNQMPNWRYDLCALLLFVPLFLFVHTPLNLVGFDLTNCWREALEGPLWQWYTYPIEIFITLSIVTLGIRQYIKTEIPKRKTEIALGTTGLVLFLASFSLGNIVGSFTDNWEIGQYGLFGMPIFAAFLAYLIVRYKTFQINILAAEALIVGIFILLVSSLFVRTLENSRIITLISIVLITTLGYMLIKSIRNELSQKEQIEKLAKNVAKANRRLRIVDKHKSEFVSIASHQLRSPLTAIRGYSSLLLEGSYGKFPVRAQEALERIELSAKQMALSIEDYLNVSRIESGNMKYDLTTFNLQEVTKHISDDLRSESIKKGILLLFKTNTQSPCLVNADFGKTQQIIHNLVNNALKYTPKGSITIFVHDNVKENKIYVEVIDTGIGMSQETQDTIFQKFQRAENAHNVNVHGTGLGLYVAKQMAMAMNGDVKGYSIGEGKGSHFILEMPLA